MNRIGAALKGDIYDAAAGVAVLRIIGIGLDLELLHSVNRGHIGNVVDARLCVVRCAVQ